MGLYRTGAGAVGRLTFGLMGGTVGGAWTWSLFLKVTSSVLRLRRRCCKWTASFEEEASESREKEKILDIDCRV